MNGNPARAVVERMLAVWATGKFGEVAELLSPDLHHVRIGGTDDVGMLAGEWHSLEEAVRPMREYLDSWADLRIRAESLIDVGPDTICALTRHSGRARLSGVPLDQRLADVFTVQDGLVVRWLSYWDRAAGLEALGLEDPDSG